MGDPQTGSKFVLLAFQFCITLVMLITVHLYWNHSKPGDPQLRVNSVHARNQDSFVQVSASQALYKPAVYFPWSVSFSVFAVVCAVQQV